MLHSFFVMGKKRLVKLFYNMGGKDEAFSWANHDSIKELLSIKNSRTRVWNADEWKVFHPRERTMLLSLYPNNLFIGDKDGYFVASMSNVTDTPLEIERKLVTARERVLKDRKLTKRIKQLEDCLEEVQKKIKL
jgi:hypothetical protein